MLNLEPPLFKFNFFDFFRIFLKISYYAIFGIKDKKCIDNTTSI